MKRTGLVTPARNYKGKLRQFKFNVRPLERALCSRCGREATHGVFFDHRNLTTGQFCEAHAIEAAAYLNNRIGKT